MNRHWERLLLIVPASMFACLGSALFSVAWNEHAADFSEHAMNLGLMIFGGSVGLLGFVGIVAAILMAFERRG